MKTGLFITILGDFDRERVEGNSEKYLTIGMNFVKYLTERGFKVQNMEPTPQAGTRTTYAMSFDGPVGGPNMIELMQMANNTLASNAQRRATGTVEDGPEGLQIDVGIMLPEKGNPMTDILHKLGHTEIMDVLRANGFVAIDAGKSDATKVVITMAINLSDPIQVDEATLAKMARQLVVEGSPDADKLRERADAFDKVVAAKAPVPGDRPVIQFVNANPTFIPGSNTFRIGRKWFDQLKPGDLVDAVNGKGERIGTLTIATVSLDQLGPALKRDALTNHGVKEMDIDNPEEGAAYLLHILESVYGGSVTLTPDTLATVITFGGEFVRFEPKAFA